MLFFNRCFDKKRLKNFILWFFHKYGERETVQLIESLKKVGFQYVTKAGISIGIDDLKIPFIKPNVINITEQKIKCAEISYQRGNITEIERQQQFVDEWNFISEKLKGHVIQFFKATDIFNPIYMMAFSGARGNISQIRQLIGMRGLMADPQGQILDFPIRSSFREGLTLTEYLISCYGARKGVVDTALRTATSGYLTRRLVDVTQQVVIGRQDCHTNRGVRFTKLVDGKKTLLSLKDRLVGRVLLEDILVINPLTKKESKLGFKNQEVSTRLAKKICDLSNQILLRSPLACYSKNSVCQLCYGWNLAYNAIVSIGEAVGVLAAQSIGEPGTQLTMRTFHTGGVFTGGLIDQIYAPFNGEVNYVHNFNGVLIRTLKGRIGFLTKTEGTVQVKAKSISNSKKINPEFKSELADLFFSNQLKRKFLNNEKIHFLLRKILVIEKNFKRIKNFLHPSLLFNIPIHTILFIRHGSLIKGKELIAELSSISIPYNHRQETEQEIFAPITGQIFFEKLILIEKVKRDGFIQKTTYGLGSLWIVAAAEWQSFINPYIFPSHGDFISKSSIFQKLQILNEKFYFFDQSICDSLHTFETFKAGSFLTKKIPDLSLKPKQFENLLLNRAFISTNFQKIYYRNFRYFIAIKSEINFSICSFYSLKNNLYIRQSVRRENQLNFDLNHLTLGLNFGFYPSNTIHKIQKSKSSSLLFNIQNNLDQSKRRYFFSSIIHNNRIKSKLKNPVTSRKTFNHFDKTSTKNTYQYWYDSSYLSLMSLKGISFWTFFTKKIPKSFDLIFPKRENNFIHLYEPFLEETKIQNQNANTFQLKKYDISKFFFIYFLFQNFALSFSKSLTQYTWVSIKQVVIILVNRQSNIDLQLSKFWNCSKLDIFQIYPTYICINSNQLESYKFNFFIEQVYNTNLNAKPILIHSALFTNFYKKNNYLNYYIIQKFLISFYNKNLSNLKFDNYFFNPFKKESKKLGFQTQFKAFAIPILLINKEGYKKTSSQIKKSLFKNKFFTFNKKCNLLQRKKRQGILGWPCTSQNKVFIDEFGYCLNFGLGFQKNIYFDRDQIILDIIHDKDFCKFDLLSFFSYRNFHKLKIRFFAHRLLSKNLVLFQKTENRINLKLYFSRSINIYTSYKNKEYHNSLLFNFIKDYFITFDKVSVKKNKSFHLFKVDTNTRFLSNKRIFLKIGFIQNLQIKNKILLNQECPTLIKTYLPLIKREISIFNFNKLKLKENIINSRVFNGLVYFSLKVFYLNSIQKLNTQLLFNKKVKNIQILYNKFEYCSIRDLIYINFHLDSTECEVIFMNPKEQDSEKNFITLDKSNLKSFTLKGKGLAQAIRSKNLMLNTFLRYGNVFKNQEIISTGGQVIYIDKQGFTVRKAIPFLITSKSLINVYQDELIKKGSRLFTFLSYQVKTGDIIQGIPKIEEFFEARLTREGLPLLTNLHTQIKQFFQTYRSNFSVFEATQKSFERIQYLIINEIQKVYCSQGIYIADKHLEIVVRQMTSKVQVIHGGNTGLLRGEVIELDWIRSIEQKLGGKKILYEPIILGITKACLETESFISAASFQETTRILAKAAIQNKIDFIRGLKQNVILGNLVPAGTGFFSPLYVKYSSFD